MKKLYHTSRCISFLFLFCSFVVYANSYSSEFFKFGGAMLPNPNLTASQMSTIISSVGSDVYSKPIDFLVVQRDAKNKDFDIDQVISSQDNISISLLAAHINSPDRPIQLVEEYYFGPRNGNYPGMYGDLIDNISKLGETGGVLLLNRAGFEFESGDLYGGSSTQAALGYALCKKSIYGTDKEKAIIKYNFDEDINCVDKLSRDDYGTGSCDNEKCYEHMYDKFGDYYASSYNYYFLANVPPYSSVEGFYKSIGWLVEMFGVSSSDLSKRTVQYGWNIDGNNIDKLNDYLVYKKAYPRKSYNCYIPDFVYSTIQNNSAPYFFEKSISKLSTQDNFKPKVLLLNVDTNYYSGLVKDPNMYDRLDKDNVVGIAYRGIWPDSNNYKDYKSPWAEYDTVWGLTK